MPKAWRAPAEIIAQLPRIFGTPWSQVVDQPRPASFPWDNPSLRASPIAMSEILSLAGRPALSTFRLAKLQQNLTASQPTHHVAAVTATFRHFVEISRPLDDRRAAHARAPADLRPERFPGRRDGERDVARGPPARHDLAVVVEGDRHRAATAACRRSSASSAAWSIASRRRMATALSRERPRRAAAAHPRPHDRGVLDGRGRRASLCSRMLRRGRSPTIPLLAEGRAALETRERASSGWRWRPTRSTTSPRTSAARARSHRRRADDVRAGQLRALPPQDLQRATGSSTARRRTRACSRMIRDTHRGASAGHGRRLLRQLGGDGRRDGRALLSAQGRPLRRTRAELTHTLMKVETHNHPTAIAPFPGAATGSGGEIRDEGATGTGAKPKAGLVGFTVSNLRIPGPAALGGRLRQAGAHRLRARRSCSRARSAPQRSTTSSAGRTSPATSARSSSRSTAKVRGYHKPIMIAGGVGNIRAAHTHKRPLPDGHAADPDRRPRHADRHGRRRRVVDGHRRQHGRPRFRFGAARQRRDAAPRAGSDRPLLAAGRRAIRSCRSTTSARAACPTRCRSWCTAAAWAGRSTCARCRRKSRACRRARSGATRRRSATCWRSRRTSSPRSRRSASASAARSPSSATPTPKAGWWSPTRTSTTGPSTCRST